MFKLKLLSLILLIIVNALLFSDRNINRDYFIELTKDGKTDIYKYFDDGFTLDESMIDLLPSELNQLRYIITVFIDYSIDYLFYKKHHRYAKTKLEYYEFVLTLSDLIKNIVLVDRYECEVNCDGHAGYLDNGYGIVSFETLEALYNIDSKKVYCNFYDILKRIGYDKKDISIFKQDYYSIQFYNLDYLDYYDEIYFKTNDEVSEKLAQYIKEYLVPIIKYFSDSYSTAYNNGLPASGHSPLRPKTAHW